jgi:hypothetical protein
MTLFAVIGAKALYLLIIWLLSAIAASWLSDRKGFGEKPGLATGLLLSFIGVIVWLVWPPKAASRWKIQGPIPRRGAPAETVAEAMALQAEAAAAAEEREDHERGGSPSGDTTPRQGDSLR